MNRSLDGSILQQSHWIEFGKTCRHDASEKRSDKLGLDISADGSEIKKFLL